MADATVVRIPRQGMTYEQARHEALMRTAKVVDGITVVLTVVRCRITHGSYRFEVA